MLKEQQKERSLDSRRNSQAGQVAGPDGVPPAKNLTAELSSIASAAQSPETGCDQSARKPPFDVSLFLRPVSSMNPAYPRRSYQALIFDCDGTLTDSMPVHYVAWRRTMARYGIDFPEERFYAMGGMPSGKIVELLASEQGVPVDSPVAAHEKELAFLELIHHLVPIVPVLEVVREFRGQLPLAVASGGYRGIIKQQLEQIGCGDCFDVLVTAEDTVRHKPEPDVFLKAAELLGVVPGECLVYEDSELGLRAAAAAGMDAIDIRTFHRPRTLLLG
jgi:HAD superfamily hydrolase (TIGR01509 family)